MRGRRPKPSHLKLVQGNPGKRKVNKREPKPKRGAPPVPATLSERGRAAWDRVAPYLDAMGVLTIADGMALELLVQAYADWLDCRDAVDQHGRVYESVKFLDQDDAEDQSVGDGEKPMAVMVRPRPEVAQMNEAWKRVRVALVEFGLTPSARARLVTGKGSDQDPLEDWLGGAKA